MEKGNCRVNRKNREIVCFFSYLFCLIDKKSNLTGEKRLKKKYETPKVEMVVFDYTETVIACSFYGLCGKCVYNPYNNRQLQTAKPTATPAPAPTNNPYWGAGWGVKC